jgi:hypothetical protein
MFVYDGRRHHLVAQGLQQAAQAVPTVFCTTDASRIGCNFCPSNTLYHLVVEAHGLQHAPQTIARHTTMHVG